MKKLIWFHIFVIGLFFAIPPYRASYAAPPHIEPPTISELITRSALQYHVSEEKMRKIIQCESNFKPSAVGDGGHSFGLSQIYLPAHRDITKEQALNPTFAIDFLAKNISQGHARIWTCARILGIV